MPLHGCAQDPGMDAAQEGNLSVSLLNVRGEREILERERGDDKMGRERQAIASH